MAENSDILERLLEYHQTPAAGDFTARVMRRARRQERRRRLILWGFGGVGAAFGVAGLQVLAEPLARMFSGGHVLTVSLALVLSIVMMSWLLHDEAGLSA